MLLCGIARVCRAVYRVGTITGFTGSALFPAALIIRSAEVSVVAGRLIRLEPAFPIFARVIRTDIAVIADEGFTGYAFPFDTTLFSIATVFVVAIVIFGASRWRSRFTIEFDFDSAADV